MVKFLLFKNNRAIITDSCVMKCEEPYSTKSTETNLLCLAFLVKLKAFSVELVNLSFVCKAVDVCVALTFKVMYFKHTLHFSYAFCHVIL